MPLPETYLVDRIKEAILAEKVAGSFYQYIADRVDNGYVRNKFTKFAKEEAGTHKALLNERLKDLTGQTYEPDLGGMAANVKGGKFSMEGAIAMARNAEARAIIFYNEAQGKDEEAYRNMYVSIIDDEKRHHLYLTQEKLFNDRKFLEEHDEYTDEAGIKLFSLLKNIAA